MALAQRNSVHNMNTSDGGHLSDSDDSSSSGHTSEDEDGGEDADGHPMMSIFASYYGITDPAAAQVDNTPKGTIDDAGFQAQDFVKVNCQSQFLLIFNSSPHFVWNLIYSSSEHVG